MFHVAKPVPLEGDDVVHTLVDGNPRLTVTVADEARWREDPRLSLQLDLRTIPPVVTAVTAERGLTAKALRDLPLARLANYAAIGVLAAYGAGPLRDELWPRLAADGSGFELRPDEPLAMLDFSVDDETAQATARVLIEELARRHSGAPPRTPRNVVSDELLERVAHVYGEALSAGRPPKKAVRVAEGVSEATAGRYVKRARERGFLAPTVRGKKADQQA